MDSTLNDCWTYYFHDPDNSDWNLNSYHRLTDVSSVDDFWHAHQATKPFLSRGMFFLMREHVYPCWDDDNNLKGGCLCMKVLKDDIVPFWEHLAVHALGEHITVDPERWSVVNGLSVSPKRYFCIVKLWLSECDVCETSHPVGSAFRLPPSYTGEVLFRSNMENIRGKNMNVPVHAGGPPPGGHNPMPGNLQQEV